MILLTGSTGFVGSSLTKYFGLVNVNKFTYDYHFLSDEEYQIVHLAGIAHDLKNISSSDEYYIVNTELAKKVFDAFLASKAKVFIILSSVKAISDNVIDELFEHTKPNPITHYGKSKLLAEQYILSKKIPKDKRVYILRPCMIHGPGNKGNLNILYNLVSKGYPWPLGIFENSRSYLSIENLCFIIKELIEREDISSGVYNVADDIPLSTNEVISIIAESSGNKSKILKINKNFIYIIARLGDFLKFPINSDRLQKLTESYVVNNAKIKAAIGRPLPVSSKNGLLSTFKSFSI